jgi:hypothetical protein
VLEHPTEAVIPLSFVRNPTLFGKFNWFDNILFVELEVLKEVVMKSSVFGNKIPYGLSKVNRRFGFISQEIQAVASCLLFHYP